MDSVEDYARQWTKREKEDLDTLSEWSLIQIRIFNKLSGSMSTRSTSIFKDPNVAKHLSLLHDKYVIVSADKAPNNMVFVFKSHYIECLNLVLTIHLASLHIPRRHLRKMKSWTIIGLFYVPLEFQPKMKNWIPKLHKCPFKQRYIAGYAKCSTRPLYKLLTCILSTVKTGLQNYRDTSYSSGGVNQMWILKNSKHLLEYIQSRSLFFCNSIITFDFSTLYTTITHSKLKD